MSEVILKVEHLKKYYPVRRGGSRGKEKQFVRACDDVSFELHAGEVLGIVGESGCGKTTAMQSVIRLIEPTEGKITLCGQDFRALKGKELIKARRNIKLIFQDPYSSLNPRMTVREIIGEPLDIAKVCKTREEREARIQEIMRQVGLDPSFAERYPHEFSGGQRQRVGIARAMVLQPEVVICDEPVSALDVSIQAKIINLLRELQHKLGTAYIFISHDLGVVHHIADRVLVMYLGRVMEQGDCDEIFSHPKHPYTRALLSSVPRIEEDQADAEPLSGDVPSPINPPSGCLFHTRCPYCRDRCITEVPALEGNADHLCACFYADERKEI